MLFFTNGNEYTRTYTLSYSQIDEVPVYKAGKVKWHTNNVDANHMPIAGRIGLYKETFSKVEFAVKYGYEEDKTAMANFIAINFRLSSRIEVDSNYEIVAKDGYSSYRVNVEKGYETKEGDGFEAFLEPKEISGKTYIGTIYG